MTEMLTNFSNIYDLQEKEQAFNTVPEMLRALGGENFYEYTQQTTRQTLENIGLNQLLIDELVTVVISDTLLSQEVPNMNCQGNLKN